jgi:hypothetical protein
MRSIDLGELKVSSLGLRASRDLPLFAIVHKGDLTDV